MSKSLADRKRSDNKKVLLIGDSGSGKTSLLGTIPGDVLVLDFDNGLDVLSGKVIQYEELHDTGPKPTAWAMLKTLLATFRKNGPGFNAICLDGITRAGEAALRWVVDKNGRGTAALQQADWGLAISEVKDMLAQITTLPCHVFVTAHYQMVKDENLGGIYFAPLIYGKDLPAIISTYFNDCWRTFVDLPQGGKEPSYRLQVRPSGRYASLKNSLGINELYAEPNVEKLLGGSK